MQLDQKLPEQDLAVTAGYKGKPRLISDIHHLPCMQAVAGDTKLPEREDAQSGDMTPWGMTTNAQITPGWKFCKPGYFDNFAVPSSFSVDAQVKGPQGAFPTMTILDSNGVKIGGLRPAPQGEGAGDTKLLQVIDVKKLPATTAYNGEEVYLRTLVVQATSGPQLLIDQVSAKPGEDPKTLKVWDLSYGPNGTQVWAAVPLESADQAQTVLDSRLYQVLKQMVGSFQASVQ